MAKDLKEKVALVAETVVPKTSRRKIIIIVLAAIVGAALLGAVAVFSYVNKYEGLVYPGVYLGGYHLGGMSGDEVMKFAEGLNSRLLKEGVIYIFNNEGGEQKIKVPTVIVSSDAARELVEFNTEDFKNTVLNLGRRQPGFPAYIEPILLRAKRSRVVLPMTVDEKSFIEALSAALTGFERQPKNAGIKIISTAPVKYEVTAAQIGLIFDKNKIMTETKKRLSVFNLEPIVVKQELVMPTIESALLNNLEEKIGRVLDYGSITFAYRDPLFGNDRQAILSRGEIADLLAPVLDDNGGVIIAPDVEKMEKYFDDLRYAVDQPAEESKFVMADGKVQEFRGGKTGQALDAAGSYAALLDIFKLRNAGAADVTSTVPLLVKITEPTVKLSEVNDFGITAVIGIGVSTFRDSHTNRIKNIAHAVARLNGTIIAPGEEFSSVHYAGPFTAENGYLPEEVIKGTQIKKEIGGGMCQIGTTLFRMAMNSGMPITERTNHSLVVGYYADPVNGNPGTDATLYEPILDLKFLNDTGSYLLLQTEIDYKKQQLVFTLWGKPDGRRGYYTHPLVSKWIPAGAPQNIPVNTLAPGEKKCQNAFKGAVASFVYTRFTSTTEKIDRTFTSYYRPLPQICMVGVDPAQCPDLSKCDLSAPAPSTTPPAAP
ncbi:MAG: VanW family protein [Patescibacteria group bacterium]|nr:VanW family protein [Patescibacteria group bacterium]